jgi:catechol 2,3-dioxygenase-like lactoylglutathione lyase family enzyme
MWLPFQLGLGGNVGISGEQPWPWIHATDLARLIVHAVEKSEVKDALLAVAPQAITNAEFTQALARAVQRPAFMHVPAFVWRALYGRAAELMLQAPVRCTPRVALDTGFEFAYPSIDAALAAEANKASPQPQQQQQEPPQQEPPQPPQPRNRIGLVTLVVRDYDEAIAYYVDKLGFTLVEDTPIPAQDKRWVVVAPAGSSSSSKGTGGTNLLLARASGAEQTSHIGNQTGGRVALFLESNDFWRDYKRMHAAGVAFCEEPRDETHSTVVVFEDLYGNRWDLLQRKAQAQAKK